MSAELLRRAAETLRNLAASCEQGAWSAEIDDRGHAWINLPAYKHAFGVHGFPDEAKYIALMRPPVALAVADLLERHAAVVTSWAEVFGFSEADVSGPDEAAIALARAILRDLS